MQNHSQRISTHRLLGELFHNYSVVVLRLNKCTDLSGIALPLLNGNTHIPISFHFEVNAVLQKQSERDSLQFTFPPHLILRSADLRE